VKSILIICKDIYPVIGPRSFRATELVNELVCRGYKVTVVCSMKVEDYRAAKLFFPTCPILNLGLPGSVLVDCCLLRATFIKRILNKSLYYLFQYPNITLLRRVFKFLRDNTDHYNLMITVAYPYSIHWGAALARNVKPSNFPCRWIADCGDPFMGNLMINPPFYFEFLERLFCRLADKITIPVEIARKAYYPEFHHKIEVIPQGFNFSNIRKAVYIKNKIPTFLYAGIFYKGSRDPRPLLDFLVSVKVDFKFLVFTPDDNLIRNYLDILGHKMEIKTLIPRTEIIKEMSKVDFLVNIENDSDSQTPSKIIDYSISGRPIISLNMKNLDEAMLQEFLAGRYDQCLIIDDLEKYNIKNVVDKFLEI
jgi:hypothetical protein